MLLFHSLKINMVLFNTVCIYLLFQRISTSQALYITNSEEPTYISTQSNDALDEGSAPDIPIVEPISFPVVVGTAPTFDGAFDSDPKTLGSIKSIDTQDSQLGVSGNIAPVYGVVAGPPSKGPAVGPPRFPPPTGIGMCAGLQTIFCCLFNFMGCVLWDNHLHSTTVCGLNDPDTYFACCDIRKEQQLHRHPPEHCKLAPGETERRKQFQYDQPGVAQQAGEAAIKIFTAPHPLTPYIEKVLIPQEN